MGINISKPLTDKDEINDSVNNILSQIPDQPGDTPKIKSNVQQIECNTAFGPNTLIYVDKKIISMTQMNIGYSNNAKAKTLGIEPVTYLMNECRVLSVPEKVFIDYTVDLIIDDAFAVECSPYSLILCDDGYYYVCSLKEGDTVQVTRKNLDTGEIFIDNGILTKIDKSRSITAIKTPVYLFISEYGNLFIPFGSEKTPNMLNFVNFKQ